MVDSSRSVLLHQRRVKFVQGTGDQSVELSALATTEIKLPTCQNRRRHSSKGHSIFPLRKLQALPDQYCTEMFRYVPLH